MVSAVVPVYRNARTLEELCRRLAAALGDDHEIVLVDDGCPEGSWPVIEALAAADARVRPVRHAANRGQNAAVLTGLAAARGEEIAVLDADLQDPPEAVPALLAELRRGDAAIVFGGRRGRYESAPRLLASRLFKRTLHVASGRRLPVDAGLFLVMRASVRDRLGPGGYVLASLARAGVPMRSVPVARERSASPSAYSGAARVRLAARAIRQAVAR
jgi:glycosyltransferase involved in cell wall biosynthesis